MATIAASFTMLYGPAQPAVHRTGLAGLAVRDLPRRPLEARPDEELIRLFRQDGDDDAFATLVRRYEDELFDYLMRRLRREDLAEEAFKRTFLDVHRRPPACDGGRPFRAWLFWLATREAGG